MVKDASDYIADHYGRCGLDICICLARNIGMWPGRSCVSWIPAVEQSFEARLAALKAGRK